MSRSTKVSNSAGLIAICCLVGTLAAAQWTNGTTHLQHRAHNRDRRYVLNYPVNGGVAKVLFGFVAPVRFHHKLRRSLNAGINLQANYRILPNVIFPYPDTIWESRFDEGAFVDTSRRQLYVLLEKLLGGAESGSRARTCLLRMICEIADTPLSHNGMVGEIMDVVFTPGDSDDLADEYKLARRYGANGVNCKRVYDECPWGHGILDTITAMHW
ncbi:uncharacterized protein LOC128270132 [Anopheles cruzii]|uniref:uncharacterized protein LOC128270132 n=1 Tax=Anopheles cruzii TaxID=68878 RepID=UPI0022EC7014|nr:uncharacterized protein LOC128270132 [Anopheles cruzii]